jgi:hypothetical protein
MDLREIGWGGMDWIDLAQDMEQCRTLVNIVKSLRGPYNVANVLTAEQLAASQEGISSIKLINFF